MPSDYWFKPKPRGYGAVPLNWRGWAVTLAYAAIVGVGGALALNRPGGASAVDWLAFVVGVVVLTWSFLALCKCKTDGEWKWRSLDR